MNWIEALILGIIQGLTEFLPVSSSGHLEIAKALLGDTSLAHESMLMTVVLHGATALATLIVFRKDVAEIFRGLLQFKWNEETKFTLHIVISMVPAAIVGLWFNDQLDILFDGQILLVGIMLLITAALLFFADKAKTAEKGVSSRNALIIGISQAIAILPGISRSGATISTSVLLGIDRTKAARFSFLMVVPLILAKMGKDVLGGEIAHESATLVPMGIGFVAALLTGILACTWMIKLVKNSKLTYFAVYCFLVGAFAIIAAILY
ncbi:MAG: undecaprenyl-diphosphate phosphatase [Bacteroidales bacterium]|nr:undecaprenyl-diphosphate phosphatase [Bacteroidales bacterium]